MALPKTQAFLTSTFPPTFEGGGLISSFRIFELFAIALDTEGISLNKNEKVSR